MITPIQPAKKTVWMSETGTVVCTTHAFPDLRRKIDLHPDEPIIFTTWDSWVRVYEEDAHDIGHYCLTCYTLGLIALSDARRTTRVWTSTNSPDYATPPPQHATSITQP